MNIRDHNVGSSNYSKFNIQVWDIIIEYSLNFFDGDILKRVLRTKKGESRKQDYEKIIHICQERIRQIDKVPLLSDKEKETLAGIASVTEHNEDLYCEHQRADKPKANGHARKLIQVKERSERSCSGCVLSVSGCKILNGDRTCEYNGTIYKYE